GGHLRIRDLATNRRVEVPAQVGKDFRLVEAFDDVFLASSPNGEQFFFGSGAGKLSGVPFKSVEKPPAAFRAGMPVVRVARTAAGETFLLVWKSGVLERVHPLGRIAKESFPYFFSHSFDETALRMSYSGINQDYEDGIHLLVNGRFIASGPDAMNLPLTRRWM